jgi:hypothetical protein
VSAGRDVTIELDLALPLDRFELRVAAEDAPRDHHP